MKAVIAAKRRTENTIIPPPPRILTSPVDTGPQGLAAGESALFAETKRIKALDGIRGIAAVIVAFFWHYKSFFETDKPFYTLGYWAYNYGWITVDLFFVLSGFVFCSVYGDSIKENKIGIKNFALLRFSRLYPLHFLTLCVVAAFKYFQKVFDGGMYMWNGYRYSISDFLINIPMSQNGWFTTRYSFNAPSWSVSVEIMMYLLFFYIFHYSKDTKKHIVNSLAMIYFGTVICISGWDTAFFNGQTGRGLTGFFIGIITAEIRRYCGKNKRYKNTLLLVCGFGAVAATVIPAIVGYSKIPDWTLITTFALFPSLIIMALDFKIFSRILSIKPLLCLGELSYSIYLWHYPVVLIVRNIDRYLNLSLDYSGKAFYIGYFILVIGISYISHHYFELPVQNKIRKRYIESSGHSA
jgi:peptidoglycan/LPS O-acetylase OafA/YrhL